MGMARARPEWQTPGYLYSQPGQPVDGWHVPGNGQRCLGACLLSQIPESPPRLPRRLVERGQLGCDRPSLRARPQRSLTPGTRLDPVGAQFIGAPPIYRPGERIDRPLADHEFSRPKPVWSRLRGAKHDIPDLIRESSSSVMVRVVC